MNVSFVNTTSSKLSSLSIVNGQLIALSDKAGLYYDINNSRYEAVGQGDSTNYGLVKVSDNIDTSAGTAASGVAASSYALATAVRQINSDLSYLRYASIQVSPGGTEVELRLIFKEIKDSYETYGTKIYLSNSFFVKTYKTPTLKELWVGLNKINIDGYIVIMDAGNGEYCIQTTNSYAETYIIGAVITIQ